MSKTIDERIVQMEFDNSNFERNVKTSMNTIDKLKKNLEFKNNGDAFKKIEDAASKVNFNGLNSKIDTVKSKLNFSSVTNEMSSITTAANGVNFSAITNGIGTIQTKVSAMTIAWSTAISEMTKKAVNAGTNLVKSLSIDQITSGFEKYNNKTGYVQTLVNSGNDIKDVNKALDQLMWYSDETSYGFTDMTQSLATMVAQGQPMNDMIPVIMGLANATAYAGKGAKEFQRVIYNMTQAMGTGYLMAVDWNSVILAGATSDKLIQSFIDTAVAAGKLEEGTVTLGNFKDSLKDKWLDTDVMKEALTGWSAFTSAVYESKDDFDSTSDAMSALSDQFDDVYVKAMEAAQQAKSFSDAIDATKDAVSSGWMETFNLIFGDYNEAVVLWTELTNRLWDAFAAPGEIRNEILSLWKEDEGRDELISAFWGLWDTVNTVATNIKREFADIFGFSDQDDMIRKLASLLVDFSKKLNNFFEKISNVLSSSTAYYEFIKRIANAVGATIKTTLGILKSGFDIVKDFLSYFSSDISYVVTAAAKIANYVSQFNAVYQTVKPVQKIGYSLLNEIIKPILSTLLRIVYTLAQPMEKYIDSIFGTSKDAIWVLQNLIEGLTRVIHVLGTVVSGVMTVAYKVSIPFANIFYNLARYIKAAFKAFKDNIEPVKSSFVKLSATIKLIFQQLSSLGSKIRGDINKSFGENTAIRKWINTISEFVKAFFELDNSFRGSATVTKIVTKSMEAVAKAVDWLAEKLGTAFNAIRNFRNGLDDNAVFNIMIDGITKFSNAIDTAINSVKEFFDSFKNSKDDVKNRIENISDQTKKVTDDIKSNVSSTSDVTKNKIQETYLVAKKNISNIKLQAKKNNKDTIDSIENETTSSIKKSVRVAKTSSQTIAEWVTEQIHAIKDNNDEAKNEIQETGEESKNAWDKFKDGASDAWSKAKPILSKIGEALVAAFKKLNTVEGYRFIRNLMAGLTLRNFIKIVKSFKDTLGKLVKAISSFPTAMTKSFNALEKAIKNMNQTTNSGVFKSIAISILALAAAFYLISKVDTDKVAQASAVLGTLAGIIAGMAILIKQLNSSTTNIADSLKSLGGLLSSTGRLIVTFAKALVVLSVALFIISKIEPDRLKDSVIALGAMMLILAAVTKILTLNWKKINSLNSDRIIAMGKIIESLGKALLIMAVAVYIIGQLETNKLWAATGALAVMMVALAILSGVILKNQKVIKKGEKSLVSTSMMMVSIAESVLILAAAVAILGNMKTEQMTQGLIGVGILIVALGAFIVAINKTAGKLASGEKRIMSVSATLIALGLSLLLITSSVNILGKMEKEALIQGLLSVLAIMAVLSLVLKTIGKYKPNAGSIFAMLGAVVMLMGILLTLKLLTKFPVEKLAIALIGLTAIMLSLSILMKSMRGVTASSGAGILLAAAALTLMIVPIKELGKLDLKTIGKGLLAIAGVLVVFIGAMVAVGALSSILTPAAMIIKSLATSLLMFGAGLFLVTTAIVGFIGAMTLFEAISSTKLFKIGFGFGSLLEGFITAVVGYQTLIINAVLLIITGLIDSVIDLIAYEVPHIIEAMLQTLKESMHLLMVYAPTIAEYLFDFVIKMLDVLIEKTPIVITKFVEWLKVVFESLWLAIQDLDPDILLKGLAAMKVVRDMMGILSLIGALGIGAALGVAVIVGIMMEMAAFSTNDNIMAGIKQAGVMAEALGEVIGKFVAGFSKGVTDSADHMYAYVERVKEVCDLAGTISKESIDAVIRTAELMVYFTAGEFISGLGEWLGFGSSSLDKFGSELVSFGGSIKLFSDSVKDINAKNVSAAAKAGEMMAVMARKIPNSGGLLGEFFGENDIDKFGAMLVSFGVCIVAFSSTVSGKVDEEAVSSAAKAGEMMASMAKEIPNSGGLIADFFGDNNIADFGTDLATFGRAIVDFSQTVEGKVKEEDVKAAKNAGEMMVDLANTIPNSGGLIAKFMGDNNIGQFGEDIVKFGEGIANFAETVKGIGDTQLNNAINAGKMLAEIGNSIPTSGGLVSIFKGEQSLSDFGGQLESFANGLVKFSKKIKDGDFTTANIEQACKVGIQLAELSKALPEDSGASIKKLLFGNQDLGDFGKQVALFGAGITAYAKIINNGGDFASKKIKASVDAGVLLADLAEKLPAGSSMSITKLLFGGKDLGQFGIQVGMFGEGIVAFNDAIMGADHEFSPGRAKLAAMAGEHLAKMAKVIPTEGGLFTRILGKPDWENFNNGISGFGTAIVNFNNTIKDANFGNTKTLKDVTEAGVALAKMAEAIPLTGGTFQQWFGVHDFEGFNKNIEGFGGSMKRFNNIILTGSKWDGATVANAIENGNAMAKMLQEIPLTDSKWDKFWKGEINFDNFNKFIVSYGGAMQHFNNMVSGNDGYNTERIQQVIADGSAVIGLFKDIETNISYMPEDTTVDKFCSALPKYGLALSQFCYWLDYIAPFNGEKMSSAAAGMSEIMAATDNNERDNWSADTLEGFSAWMGEFAGGVKEFVNAIDGINKDQMSNAREVASDFVELLESVDKGYEIIDVFNGFASSKFTRFGNDLVSFGNGIVDFEQITKTINSAKLLTDTTNYKLAVTALNEAAELGIDGVIAAFSNKVASFTEAVAGFMLAGLVELKKDDTKSKWYLGMREVLGKLDKAVSDHQRSINSSVILMMRDTVDVIDTGKDSEIYQKGKDFVDGFVSGCLANMGKAASMGTRIGNEALGALAEAIDSHSPSKESRKLGAFFSEGFGDGIVSGFKAIGDIAKAEGNTALDMLKTAIDAAGTELDSNMNLNPTIRPVLDLSDIKAGAGMIDGYFNDSSLHNINASARLASSIGGVGIDNISGANNTNTTNSTVTNTFNISGAQDPKAVANEVSKILQKQVDRRNASWA